MATIVEYNGVTFYNVHTRKWDEEVIYDSTGTDEIGKKYSFVFDCVLHQQRAPLNASTVYVSSGNTGLDNGAFGNVFALMNHVRSILNHPRKPLRISFGTPTNHETVIEILPAQGEILGPTTDIDNGPKPKVISITPVGQKAFRITFAVEATVGGCVDTTRSEQNMVISNRWSVDETMDANYYVTRRITGQLRLAAGVFAAGTDGGGNAVVQGYPGHLYKNLTIPPLELGFKRDQIAFTSNPDGLTCTYTIVDRQVHHSAPWPATRMRASHTENSQNGLFFTSECHVQLQGDAACDKRLLLERAIQVLDARLWLTRLPNYQSALIDQFTITDHIGEDAVIEAYARVNRTKSGESDSASKLNMFYDLLGTNFEGEYELPSLMSNGSAVENTDYNYQLSRVPWLYGYKKGQDESGPDWERRPAVLFFLHCYLQDPCHNLRQIGPGQPNDNELATTDYGRDREENSTVYELPGGVMQYSPSTETLSEETQAGMYHVAEVSTTYQTDTMMMSLPIANFNGPHQSDPRSREGQRDLLIQASQGNQRQATSRILPLSQTQTRRIHRLNLERIGLQPAIPAPVMYYTHGDVTAVLKNFTTEILAPVRSPDGSQQVHRVLATYEYLLDRPPLMGEPIPVGVNPVTNFQNYEGALQLNFTGNIGAINAPTTGPQSG